MESTFSLLSEKLLIDGRFSIFMNMLDASRQKLVFMHAGGGTGKTFLTCNFLINLPCAVKFVIAHVQRVLVPQIYHKVPLSTVFSGRGCQV
jgi:hypothetical protein